MCNRVYVKRKNILECNNYDYVKYSPNRNEN